MKFVKGKDELWRYWEIGILLRDYMYISAQLRQRSGKGSSPSVICRMKREKKAKVRRGVYNITHNGVAQWGSWILRPWVACCRIYRVVLHGPALWFASCAPYPRCGIDNILRESIGACDRSLLRSLTLYSRGKLLGPHRPQGNSPWGDKCHCN